MDFAFFGKACGRVNLIGEHTDYNFGFVLPTAIPQATRVALARRPEPEVTVHSEAFDSFSYLLGEEVPRKNWADHIQGVTKLLREEGHDVGGFHAVIKSDVPIGSGLSSSAALGVSLMRAMRAAFALALTDLQIARLHQRVENEFVGAKVGIMDPMASSLALPGRALFLDTLDLSFHSIRLPTEKMDLVVINSGISHRNVGSGYNLRRHECERAAALLEVEHLRRLEEKDLPRISLLPEPFCRRVRHVVKENARVLSAVSAIERQDLETLGDLFRESHESMRLDYEVSIPEIDAFVAIANRANGVFGCRMTGGGFGGSVVLVAEKGMGSDVARSIMEEYRREIGQTATLLVS